MFLAHHERKALKLLILILFIITIHIIIITIIIITNLIIVVVVVIVIMTKTKPADHKRTHHDCDCKTWISQQHPVGSRRLIIAQTDQLCNWQVPQAAHS